MQGCCHPSHLPSPWYPPSVGGLVFLFGLVPSLALRRFTYVRMNRRTNIYIYIYEPDTFRVYITAICYLQYKMESKM